MDIHNYFDIFFEGIKWYVKVDMPKKTSFPNFSWFVVWFTELCFIICILSLRRLQCCIFSWIREKLKHSAIVLLSNCSGNSALQFFFFLFCFVLFCFVLFCFLFFMGVSIKHCFKSGMTSLVCACCNNDWWMSNLSHSTKPSSCFFFVCLFCFVLFLFLFLFLFFFL